MLGIAKQPITAANVADARKALAYLEYTMKRCQEGRFESRHGVASELISHTVSTLRSKIASIPAAAEAPASYATASEREESSAPSPAAQPHLQHEPLPAPPPSPAVPKSSSPLAVEGAAASASRSPSPEKASANSAAHKRRSADDDGARGKTSKKQKKSKAQSVKRTRPMSVSPNQLFAFTRLHKVAFTFILALLHLHKVNAALAAVAANRGHWPLR